MDFPNGCITLPAHSFWSFPLYFSRMSKRDQEAKFWKHGDFGHVQEELKTLKVLCEPSELVGHHFYHTAGWRHDALESREFLFFFREIPVCPALKMEDSVMQRNFSWISGISSMTQFKYPASEYCLLYWQRKVMYNNSGDGCSTVVLTDWFLCMHGDVKLWWMKYLTLLELQGPGMVSPCSRKVKWSENVCWRQIYSTPGVNTLCPTPSLIQSHGERP